MGADASAATLFRAPLSTTRRSISAAFSLRPPEGCRWERRAPRPSVCTPLGRRSIAIRPPFAHRWQLSARRRAVYWSLLVFIVPPFAHHWHIHPPYGGPRYLPDRSSVHLPQIGVATASAVVGAPAILPRPLLMRPPCLPVGSPYLQRGLLASLRPSRWVSRTLLMGSPRPSGGVTPPLFGLSWAPSRPSAAAISRPEYPLGHIHLSDAPKAPMFRIGSFPLPIAFFLPFPPLLSIYRNPRFCNPTFRIL